VLHLLVVHELRLHEVLLLHEHLRLGHVLRRHHLAGWHARQRPRAGGLRGVAEQQGQA
jgi:hypothetical protein